MTTRTDDVLREATATIRREADELRRVIGEKQQAFHDEVDPLQEQLDALEEAVARIEGRSDQRSSSGRAPRGHNRRAILDVLRGNPGRTAAEVAEATGISKATVQATLAKLAIDGLVAKRPSERGVEHTVL